LRCRVRRVRFSCFVRSVSFSAVSRATGSVLMFCAPGIVFVSTEGVWFRFHVLRSRNIFGGTEGVGSRYLVLRARTCFCRYRARRVPFSWLARPDSFSAVPMASGPVFMFYAPGIVFGGAECVGSRFRVLRARTHFRRYRGRRVLFSCFALPDSFSAIPEAPGPFLCFVRRD
jgi:hypothetical protein